MTETSAADYGKPASDNELTFTEFCAFYKSIATRQEIYFLLSTYSTNKDDTLTALDLAQFFEVEQGVSS